MVVHGPIKIMMGFQIKTMLAQKKLEKQVPAVLK